MCVLPWPKRKVLGWELLFILLLSGNYKSRWHTTFALKTAPDNKTPPWSVNRGQCPTETLLGAGSWELGRTEYASCGGWGESVGQLVPYDSKVLECVNCKQRTLFTEGCTKNGNLFLTFFFHWSMLHNVGANYVQKPLASIQSLIINISPCHTLPPPSELSVVWLPIGPCLYATK